MDDFQTSCFADEHVSHLHSRPNDSQSRQPAKPHEITSHYNYAHRQIVLGSGSIRLLTLLPGDWADEIECSMDVVPLSAAAAYDTISYTWGVAESAEVTCHPGIATDVTAKVDGQRIVLRKNLALALRYLRGKDQSLLLWADALCINQRNETEKAEQVAFMSEIYKRCSRVYIWLGDTLLYQQSTIEDPFFLPRHFANGGHYYELPGYSSCSVSSEGSRLNEQQPQYGSIWEVPEFAEKWKAFVPLARSAWRTRFWCVQEVLLPPEAIAMFGPWRIPWKQLQLSEKNRQEHIVSCCAGAASLFMSKRFHDPESLYTIVADGSVLTDLDTILRTYRYKDCQDPRDKVYGILGLVDLDTFPSLLPDYSLSVDEVFVRAMKAIIEMAAKSGDLRCLTGSGFGSALRRSLPTWVRDFAQRPSRFDSFHEASRLESYSLYNAANGLSCASELSIVDFETREALIVPGVKLARICWVGETLRTSFPADVSTVLRSWFAYVEVSPGTHGHVRPSSNEDYSHVDFWRVICGDKIAVEKNDTHFRRIAEHSPDMEIIHHGIFGIEKMWRGEKKLSIEYRYWISTMSACFGRAMFQTEDGRMGLCGPEARPGDQVWILHGGRVPFLLRPRVGQAEGEVKGIDQQGRVSWNSLGFFGECFLQGCMDGEAVCGGEFKSNEVIIL